MSVVLVDWLGRGGIAQTSEAWAMALEDAGIPVEIVTRPDRELGQGCVRVHAAPDAGNRLAAHRAVAREGARRIREVRPRTVVVQNYVLPPLEGPVFGAARAVGAQIIQVVHDHRLHTWQAGTRFGMARRLRAADRLVAHSEYVAEGVRQLSHRDQVSVVPLPVPVGMLSHPRVPASLENAGDDVLWCGHFGVLSRAYKGTDTVEALAEVAPRGWRFVVAGVGAPPETDRLVSRREYLTPGAMVGLVAETDVTAVPYRFATQSAVIVLAQTLGSVPVASAVGGIPEQIDDGVDGLLVPAGAPIEAWCAALDALRDDDFRKELAEAGTERAWRDHDAFVEAVKGFVQ